MAYFLPFVLGVHSWQCLGDLEGCWEWDQLGGSQPWCSLSPTGFAPTQDGHLGPGHPRLQEGAETPGTATERDLTVCRHACPWVPAACLRVLAVCLPCVGLFLPCPCRVPVACLHAPAMCLSCLSCPCYVPVMCLPCVYHVSAVSLPCPCHVSAMSLPCVCLVPALCLLCPCHVSALFLPCPCRVPAVSLLRPCLIPAVSLRRVPCVAVKALAGLDLSGCWSKVLFGAVLDPLTPSPPNPAPRLGSPGHTSS